MTNPQLMDQTISGKVAIVTGGSRGIGAAIARRLARQGADVAITYVPSPEKANAVVRDIEAMGRCGLAIQADAADSEAVKAAVVRAVAVYGHLDILVNNAGIITMGTVDEFSLDDFDRIVAVNVRAIFAATQAASKHIADYGRVINIGSITADISNLRGAAFYSMSKAAVARMSHGFAIDLAPRGITVNNVQPGATETDMNPADAPHSNQLRAMIPLHRYCTADEVASLVGYLTRTSYAR